jgi:acyl-CoA thioesterase
MRFSEVLDSITPTDPNVWSVQVDETWLQSRAVFGGLVAALCNEAMRKLVPRERPLRAIEVTFAGPAIPGQIRLEAHILRVGRAVTIAQGRVLSEGQIVTQATGIYGESRASALGYSPPAQANVVDVETLKDVDMTRPGRPAFSRHFGMRWAQGASSFSGSSISTSKAYVRHASPGIFTESHFIALCDSIPSPSLQMLKSPAPASSLIWTLEFVRPQFEFPIDAWWRLDTSAEAANDGYVNQSGVVVNPAGEVAAFSRQLVTIYG